MEIKVLQHFLMVAREENITRAAQLLYVTQPTLSRQLMQLEEELGIKLFHRSKHNISLTDDGMLLKQRAQEIMSLAEKTKKEFPHQDDMIIGEITIGCGEMRSISLLSNIMADFRAIHPLIRYEIHSGNAYDIKERIERGTLELGLLIEPVDIGEYEFMRMSLKEEWGGRRLPGCS